MDNRILPIVVTFNPNLPLLQRNINCLLEGCDKVLVWDNTPNGCCRLSSELTPQNKLHIISNKSNAGISKAINQAAEIAYKEGYEYILTMDQDSILCNIEDYIKSSLHFQRKHPCIIGPRISRSSDDKDQVQLRDIIEVDDIITSGAIIPMSLFKEIGGFNEMFFVDAIDTEFCIRAKKYGYKTYLNKTGRLVQRFGEPHIHSILGHKFISSNYSPFRLWGIFRNHILIGRIYGWDRHIRKLLTAYARSYIPKIILCESNKWKKLSAIAKGVYEGITLKIEK